ncbi:MAG: hypothetical protein ACREO9_06120 [Lysobacterales bacterium]
MNELWIALGIALVAGLGLAAAGLWGYCVGAKQGIKHMKHVESMLGDEHEVGPLP